MPINIKSMIVYALNNFNSVFQVNTFTFFSIRGLPILIKGSSVDCLIMK